jgi:uncharacterized protein (DUF2252 family)
MRSSKPSLRVVKPERTDSKAPAAPTPMSDPAHRSHAEHEAVGKTLRQTVSRDSHAKWRKPADRIDPIAFLQASDAERLPDLVPIRWGRMLASPFAFYRGSAGLMAADLAKTPSTGLRVQACGDCHLMNFGGFATPERSIIFDMNDFDETLPAFKGVIDAMLAQYRETLSEDRRTLLDRYRPMDAAIKVVGIGSVGRRCWILLMMSTSNEPLFLQFKEAAASVLEHLAEG